MMELRGRFVTLTALAGSLFLSTALAQTTQPAASPQANPSQDQYSGVSHPPADQTIQADEDAPAPQPKPSAAIPMTPATSAPAAPAPVTPAPAAEPTNPDYGIVTGTTTSATLTRRSWNPDDDIVNYVPSNPNQLAPGTNIRVRLKQGLSSTESRAGEGFHAVVDRDVYKEGKVIIPAGAQMSGRIVRISQGHHLGPHATIRLRPETITLPDGTEYHIYAEAVQSKAPGTRANDEGGIEASPHYKKDAVEYGLGTGAGALAGGEIGGPVGAGVGTLVGAGVVTAHMLMAHPAVADLPEGSLLTFSLTEPMQLTPTTAKN